MTLGIDRPIRAGVAAVLVVGALGLTACAGGDGEGASSPDNTITLVTHDSFAVSKDVLAAFEKESGYTVKQVAPGDAGTLVNQLVLTKDHPLGDIVFGIDNTFAGRAIGQGVLDPYTPAALPASAAQYAVGDDGRLTPIDIGDVCVNVDHEWFAARGLAEPTGLDDLADPRYKDMLVVENPATSSPGLAFMLATVGAYGANGWQDYWSKLAGNGLKVTEGWSDAYNVDFSGGEGAGSRPLVVSYSTSPASTMNDAGTVSRTGALLDTCFRQVEYAGVLHGAANPQGAHALIDFLLSQPFQADIPPSMYMYPVDSTVALPGGWAQFAPLASKPFAVPADEIDANRERWIKEWTSAVIG